MEKIDKIRKILSGLDIEFPEVDVFYEGKNIVGYIASDSFKDLTDEECQRIIWKALEDQMGKNELISILAIFHETKEEKLFRLNEDNPSSTKVANKKLWIHETPDMSKYWMVIDFNKFGDEYKTIYIIVNSKDNWSTGMTFKYGSEIIDFMQLEQHEIYPELFSKAFENAEAEIKLQIMRKYENMSEKNIYGKNNPFNYIFNSFKLKPYPFHKAFFNEKEVALFEKLINGKMDNFSIKEKLQKCISISKSINSERNSISE
jgi:acid stress-induced BolA-like protein IbaG/YrbA